MLVQDSLHRSVARTPDKVALVCDGSRLTYAEIEAAANRLANALREHGVRRGDRVGIFLNNSVEAVVSIFAVLKAGAVFVVINHTTKEDKLAYILNNCRATALVGDAQKQSLFDSLLERVTSLRFVVLTGRPSSARSVDGRLLDYAEIQASCSADRPQQVNIDVDLACLIYTSGSTGDPKGVMSDHSNVVFAATSITTYLQNVKDDVILSVLPLSFDYGLYQLLMTFHFGGRLVLERSFAYPSAVLQRLEQERVTGFPGVPTMFAILVGMDLTSYDLSNLRYITNTAAALPPSHITTLRRKFPTATMFSMYGLTETKRTLYLPPDRLDSKPGSVGIAIPGTEVWIADANGNRLGPGQTGELVGTRPSRHARVLGGTRGHSQPFPTRSNSGRASLLYRRPVLDG